MTTPINVTDIYKEEPQLPAFMHAERRTTNSLSTQLPSFMVKEGEPINPLTFVIDTTFPHHMHTILEILEEGGVDYVQDLQMMTTENLPLFEAEIEGRSMKLKPLWITTLLAIRDWGEDHVNDEEDWFRYTTSRTPNM